MPILGIVRYLHPLGGLRDTMFVPLITVLVRRQRHIRNVCKKINKLASLGTPSICPFLQQIPHCPLCQAKLALNGHNYWLQERFLFHFFWLGSHQQNSRMSAGNHYSILPLNLPGQFRHIFNLASPDHQCQPPSIRNQMGSRC